MKDCARVRLLLLSIALAAAAASVTAAPGLGDINRGLARVQAFEPAMEPGQFVTRGGVRVSPDGLATGPHFMRIQGANSRAHAEGEQILPGKTHYFIGNDPRQWRTNVPNYARIRYRGVYPGIDVLYYGAGKDIEFDFVLAPGADASQIQLALSGPDVQLHEPKIYQGSRLVAGRAVRRRNRVTFELAAYDHSRPLVIDPVIGFATLLGGGSVDSGAAIAVDGSGAAYVTGSTSVTTGNVVTQQAFAAKIGSDGATVVYFAYLRGSGPETGFGRAIAVDASGSARVTGITSSPLLTDLR